jgi:large subunit ribosomal protein L10
MPTERKIATVADLSEKLSRMQLAIVADYRGLTVAEISDLRAKLREHGAEFIVAKNTLTKIAAREQGITALEPLLEGPTAIAFAYDDVAKIAKTLGDYLGKMPKVTVRGGVLGMAPIPADGLEQVAKMPSRQEVLGQIAGATAAPLANLVGLVNAPVADVVNLVNTIVSDIPNVIQARITQLEEQEKAAA